MARLMAGLALFVTAFAPAASSSEPGEQDVRPANDLGLPTLPPVSADSDLSDILYGDRYVPDAPPAASDGGATPQKVTLSLAETGTGFTEAFWYQLPTGYDPLGPPVPMMICWHGYGASAQTVHNQSTIDEECDARGWIYLSVTGLDDQLFGSPPSQEHAELAIRWVLDNFNVDEDRLYMTGFSMGAGVVANFAALHRDPNDIMIAGLGMVAGSWDRTQTYNVGSPLLQAIMENPYNFGGSPLDEPFAYRQASCLYFSPTSYPALPGTLVPSECLGVNLGGLPVYMVRDPLDTTGEAAEQGPVMASYLTDIGAIVSDNLVELPGEVHHTWEVLDEVALFDFLEGATVDRFPADFTARLDRSRRVSYLDVRVIDTTAFANVIASADDVKGTLTLSGVDNTSAVTVNMGQAGLGAHPAPRITASSAHASGYELRLGGFDVRPSYLVDAVTGEYVAGVDSSPLTGRLVVQVPGNGAIDVVVVFDPYWTADLWTSPEPAQVGGAIELNVDSDPGNVAALVVVAAAEELRELFSVTSFAASFNPPSIVFVVPLDGLGDITLADAIPDDPVFSGVRVVLQAIAFDAGSQFTEVTNLWGLNIE